MHYHCNRYLSHSHVFEMLNELYFNWLLLIFEMTSRILTRLMKTTRNLDGMEYNCYFKTILKILKLNLIWKKQCTCFKMTNGTLKRIRSALVSYKEISLFLFLKKIKSVKTRITHEFILTVWFFNAMLSGYSLFLVGGNIDADYIFKLLLNLFSLP